MKFGLSQPDRLRAESVRPMKKNSKSNSSDEMPPEYDFSGGERGEYSQRFREGADVIFLDLDGVAGLQGSAGGYGALRKMLNARSRRLEGGAASQAPAGW